MEKENFTLLTQDEIDTLLDFLKNQYIGKDGQVLSQESIDKLVVLLTGQKRFQFKFDLDQDELSEESFIADVIEDTEKYELDMEEEEDGFVMIYAISETLNQKIKITPKNLETGKLNVNDCSWGTMIEPVLFDKAASIFKVKYSREVFDKVCGRYAKMRFGSEDAKVPGIFLPDTVSALDNIK